MLDCEIFSNHWVQELGSLWSRQSGVDPTEHRPTLESPIFPGACVCRPVDRKEIQTNRAAAKATQQEWGHLRPRRAWGENNPREGEDVAREARETRGEVHVGIAFGFVVERHRPSRGRPPLQVQREGCFPGQQREVPTLGNLCVR